MGSVLFDFDSTLVPCESLEHVLAEAADLAPEARREIEALTRAGMEGRLPFGEALRRRLEIAPPTRPAVLAVATRLVGDTTVGAIEVVLGLQDAGHEVRVVSGGFVEILATVGGALGIPSDRVHGVTVRWDEDGAFAGLVEDDGFATSKVAGLRAAGLDLPRPAVGVGDGATDLALREAGLVDRFVAYTEHVRREEVVAEADATASGMAELGAVLGRLLA